MLHSLHTLHRMLPARAEIAPLLPHSKKTSPSTTASPHSWRNSRKKTAACAAKSTHAGAVARRKHRRQHRSHTPLRSRSGVRRHRHSLCTGQARSREEVPCRGAVRRVSGIFLRSARFQSPSLAFHPLVRFSFDHSVLYVPVPNLSQYTRTSTSFLLMSIEVQ